MRRAEQNKMISNAMASTLPGIHDCPAPSSSCFLTAPVLPSLLKPPVKPSVLEERNSLPNMPQIYWKTQPGQRTKYGVLP